MKIPFLSCSQCRKEFPIERVHPRCSSCNEPLEVIYPRLKKGKIPSRGTMLERYQAFFPFSSIHKDLSLGEGNTPLVLSSVVGPAMGIEKLFFKNETQNPTWSFKDRGTISGLEHALSLGFKKIGTVSTGNMAVSVAAYGTRAKVDTYVLVSHGLPEEKIGPIAIYHPHFIMVEGDYGELYFKSLELGARFGIYFINSDIPFRVEGSKTIAFEICEQMDFHSPDYVVVPVSAGGNIRGILKGFEEFYRVGLIDRIPKMIASQASGCSPITNAFEEGREAIDRVPDPHTIAHAIENPFPPSGNQVLRKLKENGGTAVKVRDTEILEAQALMAKEGVFGQPAAAVPLAATKKLLASGYLKSSDSVVCIVTGGGLKYTAALGHHSFEIKTIPIEKIEEIL
ncbi:MAG TPA: threonine synthase [Thermodesulfobacteriota bacterium]|nr:threonine synthase [Thermodesulfobacteriota bacterium]